MKLGIIGTGSIAEDHIRALRTLQRTDEFRDVTIVDVAGRDPAASERFALEQEISRWSPDIDTLLQNDHVDAVLITTPTDLHAIQVGAALKAGKHVLCEIPLATSLVETDELLGLAQLANRTLMVCHTQRFFAPLIEARRWVDQGLIDLHMVVSRYLFHRRDRINWKGKERTWTDNLLWHHGCHSIDATLWLMGATEVDVDSRLGRVDPELGIPMDLAVVMRDRDGVIADVVNSYHARIPQHDYLLIGERASLHYVDGALRSDSGEIVPSHNPDPLLTAMPRQNAEFIRAVRETREPLVTPQSVRLTMSVLQRIQNEFRDATS